MKSKDIYICMILFILFYILSPIAIYLILMIEGIISFVVLVIYIIFMAAFKLNIDVIIEDYENNEENQK